ncbi:MAG: DNA polymerase IV [ANME-2 cluster archaeon]|nr:DNA polymerase IV [ANME-2 cluster archaeon]MBC2701752.1 DNA polymerase IV [ANME-2 cluster archaeon]MBC2707950.1 DNA polymerase IV [ANME-2 cluster archaeon]MBC2745722.1 DNA polymerase IV [ANME-2 cluster archaeon]MBC2761868.1 DNA polymerase IV [ANME-2 cluster archaeon]
MSRIILHVDMDSFYASVEQRRDPSLKGRPVVVGSDPKGGIGRGVVSTCSYEAREFRIHSGMPISQAYKLCQDAVYLRVDMQLYKEVSCRVMEILRSEAGRFQQVSVDEAYLDISEKVRDHERAVKIAQEIKVQIKAQEGLTCSIGIAPTRSAAKIASDLDKPDGLTVVEPDKVAGFLEPLEVRRLQGIGRKNEEILHGLGIRTIGQLARFDRNKLVDVFGKWGTGMHLLAQGVDDSEVEERGVTRSLSREHTFDVDTGDTALLYGALDNIAELVHKSLQKRGFSFRTVSVKVRQADFTTFTRARTLYHDTRDQNTIRQVSHELAREFFDGRKIRLLGVRLSNLGKNKLRQTTFEDFI